MLVVDESPAKTLVNEGGLRLARGDVDGAERSYREAIAVDPDNATAHANLGYLLAASGDHEAAMRESERALSLDPTRSAAWAHLGMSQIALGSVEDGLASLARAVRLDSGNHFAWNAIGRSWLALGHPHRAEQAWASAVAQRPDDEDLLIAWATALAAQDRTAEALQVLHRATAVAPESARARLQLGVVALVHADYGTAGDALLTALELAPGDPAARFHLALLHLLVGARDEAETALRALAADEGDYASKAADLLSRWTR